MENNFAIWSIPAKEGVTPSLADPIFYLSFKTKGGDEDETYRIDAMDYIQGLVSQGHVMCTERTPTLVFPFGEAKGKTIISDVTISPMHFAGGYLNVSRRPSDFSWLAVYLERVEEGLHFKTSFKIEDPQCMPAFGVQKRQYRYRLDHNKEINLLIEVGGWTAGYSLQFRLIITNVEITSS